MSELSQRYSLRGKKEPAFVAIYEDLFQRLEQGEYQPGDQLPPETTLAERYGVSRNTLRQALAILCEDGRIYNVQGKGSFVCDRPNVRPICFEKLTNPAFSCATVSCTGSEVNYGFSPTALIVQQKMRLSPNDIALIADVRHFHDETPVSYTFIEVPVKMIPDTGVDLNDSESVKTLLNNWIYDAAATALSRITFSIAEENISQHLNVPLETQIVFIEEILYNVSGDAIALCKHYLLSEYYNICIVRKS
ncbi:MAG TPA: GntR family transcriptional regulator [Feifaniaceae bacterium]|nr:GntR family transcriptional regulator [Feifaniaceae bacterium]